MLTSLPESIRAFTFLCLFFLFFQQNYIGYQMYGTRLRIASLLVLVSKAEVAKTDISFSTYLF